MTDIIIRGDLASRLRERASKQGQSVEDLLADLLNADFFFDPPPPRNLTPEYPPEFLPGYPPRPASSLTDADIDVPEDVTDKEAYRQAERQIRPKLYVMARDYWREVGDEERLALTDEELDKQFWLIDHEGRPRFKSEKGEYTPPPDPMEAFFGLFADSEITDASTTSRERLEARYGRLD